MKKLFAILLVAVMMLSLVACGGNDGPNPAIVKYMKENGQTLISSLEDSFASSSGMTCTSSYEVIGDGFVIDININELNDLPDAQKELMQETYDSMSGVFEAMLPQMQRELPELEYFTFNINEGDGDLIASISAGN